LPKSFSNGFLFLKLFGFLFFVLYNQFDMLQTYKKSFWKNFLCQWFLFSFFICFSFSADCIVRKGGLDVGSGTTKIMIADIDVCSSHIREVLFSDSIKLDYQDELRRGGGHKFSPAVQFRFIMETGAFFRRSVSGISGDISWTGGATAAFRQAENAPRYLRLLSGLLGFNIRILSVEEEAEKTFWAVSSVVNERPENIISWEIGSGSTQIGSLDDSGRFVLYSASVASVTFKNMVIEKIQNRDPRVFQSPNPMTEAALLSAVELAAEQAKSIPPVIRRKISSANVRVFGTGGVHLYSIQPRAGTEKFYVLSDVLALLRENTSARDEDFTGPFASTQVTNLALVYGFMRELGIKEVVSVKTGLLQGLLVHSSL
jgi:exopolyphosphatase/guanosine-5'-triphosphate,3'-diphosphate pyrophosphatase